MEVRKVIFDESTFGTTQTSLQMLRNALARAVDQRIAVFQIQTNDLCCGYLILNRDTGIATFTGDGFRLDGGGEGGTGYRSAEALFTLFGLSPIPGWGISVDLLYGDVKAVKKALLTIARGIAVEAQGDEGLFVKPSERDPHYVRG